MPAQVGRTLLVLSSVSFHTIGTYQKHVRQLLNMLSRIDVQSVPVGRREQCSARTRRSDTMLASIDSQWNSDRVTQLGSQTIMTATGPEGLHWIAQVTAPTCAIPLSVSAMGVPFVAADCGEVQYERRGPPLSALRHGTQRMQLIVPLYCGLRHRRCPSSCQQFVAVD
ncbi:hypothetical protein BR93DRAFT_2503 [Coniochaeta sp. PMI_546]|nr:hypothetical protein BR93DRAFT_2503 [Coniochaeta sp. PMI_546]